MLVIPALDLRNGGATLPEGIPQRRSISRDETVRLAHDYTRHGFGRIHIVDLNASEGTGSNASLVHELLRTVPAEMQVGGGVRDSDGVRDTLEAGAVWAVLAARALPHVDSINDLVTEFPDEVVLSVSFRDRRVETSAWPSSLPHDVLDLARELAGLPLAALLLRALDREGSLDGPDYRLIEDAVDAAESPVFVAGGVGSMGHLRSLEDRGAAGVIIGTALHTAVLHPGVVAAEFPA